MSEAISYSDGRAPSVSDATALYRSVGWSSAEKPEQLHGALCGAHRLVTAWHGEQLVGAGYAISDGNLVVHYPHLVVHRDYQRRGIGETIMRRLMEHYSGFHQQSLIADAASIAFYERLGFTRAGSTAPMWIYGGNEH